MKLPVYLLALAMIAIQVPAFAQATILEPGKKIEKELLKGETHHYPFHLKKGEHLESVIRGQGPVLGIDLVNSSGKKMLTFHTPFGGFKDTLISFEATRTGNYQLDIYPFLNFPDVPDSLKPQIAEVNQGKYTINEIRIFSSAEYRQKLAQEKADELEFIKWITANAHEIKSVDANSGFADLQPLKNILNEVQVVGLGEATHGTSEFFRMKHRMLEFLVKEMGYTSFYIEASMSRCRYINDYVLYGKGDLDTATAIHGFYVWRVEEVRNMIEWMKEYNTSAPESRKIKFYGYDMQINDFGFRELKEFYSIVNAEKLPILDSLQVQFDSATSLLKNIENAAQSGLIFQTAYRRCLEMLNDIILNEGAYQYLAGKEKYDQNLMNLKLIVQQAESYKSEENFSRRDFYMAQNILSLLNSEKPDSKAVVWAHNAHITKTPETMGGYLADVLKDKYYAIGFEFYSGSFQAKNFENNRPDIMTLGNPPDYSLPYYLNKAGRNEFFIDFRNTGANAIKNFSKKYEMHDIGSVYAFDWPATHPAQLNTYDGLIFIKNTNAAKNLTRVVF